MDKLILLVFLVAFVDSIIYFVCKAYNKLVVLRNTLNINYQGINKELTFRMELCRQFIPIITNYIDKDRIDKLNGYINDFNVKVSIKDLGDIYYGINSLLDDINNTLKEKGFNSPEWDKAFAESDSRIESIRVIYNDNVLKMNNQVASFGSSIIAKIFGFAKWPYFRNQ